MILSDVQQLIEAMGPTRIWNNRVKRILFRRGPPPNNQETFIITVYLTGNADLDPREVYAIIVRLGISESSRRNCHKLVKKWLKGGDPNITFFKHGYGHSEIWTN